MTAPIVPQEMLPALLRIALPKAQGQPLSFTLPKPYAEWQKMLIGSNISTLCFPCSTKVGKALNIDTPIPTPSGWTTMGALKEGDEVFDEHGQPTLVEFATDVMTGRQCFEVVFSDGSTIVADAEHLWLTTTHSERVSIARVPWANNSAKVRTTTEILGSLHLKVSGVHRPNHAVANVSGPLAFTKRALPIDPYVLGVWLGDGTASSGCITKDKVDAEIFEHFRAAGVEVGLQPKSDCTWRVTGLTALLNQHGILNNKHVPDDYLVSDAQDRLSLLQGLMDTDGTVGKRGRCAFYNMKKQLVDSVDAIAVSLGIKVIRGERRAILNGVDHGTCYMAQFVTELPVFRLKRKLERIRPVAKKTFQRTIVAINEVPSVPVRCIRVASPSHLFLAGKACIPTHNTSGGAFRISRSSFAAPREQAAVYRIIAPTHPLSRLTYEYLTRLFPAELASEVLKNLSSGDAQRAAEAWRRFTPERKDSRGVMVWPHNGARIECIHGQDPEVTIEGGRVHGNVFDEAGKLKEKAWSSGISTTTQTRGWNCAYGTPRGKRHWFYELFKQCEEHMAWAKRYDKPLEMFAAQARTIDNPFIDSSVVERAKRMLPDRIFRQLYLAEFLDDGTVFTGYRACVEGDAIDLPEGKIEFWVHPDAPKLKVVLGCDWAKRDDYAVCIAIDPDAKPHPRIVGFARTHGVAYRQAIGLFAKLGQRFEGVHLMRHDRTGVGDVIDEMLQGLPYPIEPIVFTNSSKAHMVERWMVALQSGEVLLPNWKPLIDEHDSYDCTTTALGLPKYGAIEGEHDDIVTACMLAYGAAAEMRDRDMLVMDLDSFVASRERTNPDSIEGWYASLTEDDDDF